MIDIVISTHNRSDLLGMAISSVLNQTNSKYHLYILDNCSTDNTSEIVDAFKNTDITYIKNDKNLGMIGNWNKALTVGKSEYVHIFHDDDILEPHFVDNVCSIINENNNCAFIHTAANIIDDKGEFLKESIQPYETITDGNKFFSEYLEFGKTIICPSVVINRRLLPKGIQFSEYFPFTADYNFWLRISNYGSVGYVRTPSLSYRMHTQSTSSTMLKNIEKKIQERLRFREFLCKEISDRKIGYPGAEDRYLIASLIADIWFVRRLGGSFHHSILVAYKCCKIVPSLMKQPRFYITIIKIMLPTTLLGKLAVLIRGMSR